MKKLAYKLVNLVISKYCWNEKYCSFGDKEKREKKDWAGKRKKKYKEKRKAERKKKYKKRKKENDLEVLFLKN